MRRLAWIVPIACFLLDPSVACGPAEPQYQYGAAEMRAAVEGNWSFAITPEGGTTPIQLTVKIAQAAPGAQARASGRAFVRAAHACGSRTLVRSAGACLDTSVMPLAVTFVSGDPSFSTAMLSGDFEVNGTVFDSGAVSALELRLGAYVFRSGVAPDGALDDPHIGPGLSGPAAGTLTIVTRS
jgi:hypothetical protein